MNFFDGLYSYEIVLLVPGVVLFFVFLGGFLTLMIKGESFSKLLPFFTIPVVMIGYPGIQSVSFQDGVDRNPHNEAAKATLQQTVAQASALKIASPTLIANLARAQAAVGKSEAGAHPGGSSAQDPAKPRRSCGREAANCAEPIGVGGQRFHLAAANSPSPAGGQITYR